MNATQSNPVFPGDEIALAEVWQALARRWRWIAAALVVALLGAAAYLAFKTPSYQASVKLRIGQVAGAGLFETAEVLSSRLLAQYGQDVADGVKREPPFLKRAAPTRGVAAAVDLVAEGEQPGDAAGLLERVFRGIDSMHRAIYNQNLKYLTERLQSMDSQRSALSEQYEDASALLERLKQSDPVQASLMALERGRISASILALDADKPDLAQKLTAPQTQPTELLSEIVAPQRPATPRKSVVLALAVGLGLAGGVALAFLAEFVVGSQTTPQDLEA